MNSQGHRHSWWGIRVMTGPDVWWFGDEQGPYRMDQSTAAHVASEMNILANERRQAYRDADIPHYRYAAAPLMGLPAAQHHPHPPTGRRVPLMLPPAKHAAPTTPTARAQARPATPPAGTQARPRTQTSKGRRPRRRKVLG